MVYQQPRQSDSLNKKKDFFLKKSEDVMSELNKEINRKKVMSELNKGINHKKVMSELDQEINQLYKIKSELENMHHSLSSKIFVPSYTRCIIDSWDHADPLAEKLLGLYYDFLKL